MNQTNQNAPIFIVGCPRSGTGLLRDLLRAHPRLTFPQESHFIPQLYKEYRHRRQPIDAPKLAERILRLPWVHKWAKDLPLEPSQFAEDKSYRQVVERVFEAWARSQNKPRWGDKTPQNVTQIPVLVELFPDCQILHIVRDGRDVAMSWLRTWFSPGNMYMAARQWQHFVSAGRNAGQMLAPETYKEVRYEDLLDEPEATLRQVCAFLGESFDPAMLNPNFLARGHRPPLFGRRKRQGYASKSEIVRANHGKWKATMFPSDKILFESVAGPLLESLGYETAGHIRHVSRLEKLAWAAHHYSFWLAQRLNSKENHRLLIPFLRMTWTRIRHHG